MAAWPDSLKEYARRVLELAEQSINKEVANEELRQIIYTAHTTNTIYTTDWANVPLPKTLAPPPVAVTPAHSKRKGMAGSPSLTPEEQERREKRARRFEAAPDPTFSDPLLTHPSKSIASRFGSPKAAPVFVPAQTRAFGARPTAYGSPVPKLAPPQPGVFVDPEVEDPNVIDWDKDTVVGTCTVLEKPYLRLTSAPDPRSVRPLSVLEQTLSLLKSKWRSEHNYAYICDQFKSLRQDLTVQRIKNPFTVQVYEIHARIALEKGDLGEYNQCQSQLLVLYELGIPGRVSEFTAYRILYLLHTGNRRELNTLLPELQRPVSSQPGAHKRKDDPAVHHALAVRRALLTGDYHKFFSLYLSAPNMNAYIMDHFADRERTRALLTLAKAYRPTLPLTFIQSELAFQSTEEASAFLHSVQADRWAGENKWDAKVALPFLLTAAEKLKRVDIKGQL